MPNRLDIEKKELNHLAPYAVKSSESRGREFKESKHEYRGCFQRDKDRITYSTAFRRLQYKTQVFVNYEGDHYRTRLTHTLEVTQIARSLARNLGLNEDLVEAIALAHDIGHTPFGHAGEYALNAIMQKYGGFEHNRHALRIVDYYEEKYPDFKGLNLTWEVREGIIKHSSTYDKPKNESFSSSKRPSLEGQVVNLADEIAYNNHDLDDGISSGLISPESLDTIELWKRVKKSIVKKYPKADTRTIRSLIIKNMINIYVKDLTTETIKNIKKYNIDSVDKVRTSKKNIVSFSPEFEKQKKQVSEFLYDNLYMHPYVIRMSDKSTRFLGKLFNAYLEKPQLMPKIRLKYIEAKSTKKHKYQVICDYIAGMTDRFALQEYKKLFDPNEKV
ncbi:MAG: deoxyguanosinetriphosphate triphosphohydrolase [Candidatus Kappaea frigidicola]|nr:deoxyguanosinetriphosphate triphosphohydrolase [Candidatus Kappaea frigidicola]